MPNGRLCQAAGCRNPIPHSGKYCGPSCRLAVNSDRSGGPDACWIWTGTVNRATGYGQFDRDWTAHRLSYRVHYGVDPGDLCVMHKCDCRVCINPRHLTLGTRRQNWADAVAKGRPMAATPKLSEKEKLAIRRSAAKTGALARQYGVDTKTIWRARGRHGRKTVSDYQFDAHYQDDSRNPDAIYYVGIMTRPSPSPSLVA